MKLKPRLRHFWRNNKKCIGMYLTFYCIAMAILALCLGGYKKGNQAENITLTPQD